LLGDGAGPLYNHHCAVDLETALREVTAQLDSALSLAGRCGTGDLGTSEPTGAVDDIAAASVP
jgi:hypothetical protein